MNNLPLSVVISLVFLLHLLIMRLTVSYLSPHDLLLLFLASFSHQCELIVIHCKSPKVSRTLHSVLPDLNMVVWILSARPPISNSLSLFTEPLGIVPRVPITTGITDIFIFHCFFLVLLQVLSTYFSFRFLWFLLNGLPRRQSSQVHRFSIFTFFLNYYKVCSSLWDYLICLYHKISEFYTSRFLAQRPMGLLP